MKTKFENPLELPIGVILLRLQDVDTEVQASLMKYGDQWLELTYIPNDSLLTNDDIETILSTLPTQEELDKVAAYKASSTDFKNLPGWADWTPQEVEDHIDSITFNGMSEAAVKAQIDSINDLAQVKIALTQIVEVMYAFSTILKGMAKAILFIRNKIIR